MAQLGRAPTAQPGYIRAQEGAGTVPTRMSPRTTEGLFVATFELFLLTVVGFTLFVVALEVLVTDPSGAAPWTWVNDSLAALATATLLAHAVVAGARKTRIITGSYHASVSSAYVAAVTGLLVVYTCMWAQALQPQGTERRVRVGVVDKRQYVVTQGSDWTQAVAGSQGWWQPKEGSLWEQRAGGEVGIVATAMAASVLAYACTTLAVGCYAAFSSAPEGSWLPLFLEPSALACANSVLVWGAAPAVQDVFARCRPWATPILQVMAFNIVACFYDRACQGALEIALDLLRAEDRLATRRRNARRAWGVISIPLVPIVHLSPFLFGTVLSTSTPTVSTASLGLSVAGAAMAWYATIQYVFQRKKPRGQRPDVVTRGPQGQAAQPSQPPGEEEEASDSEESDGEPSAPPAPVGTPMNSKAQYRAQPLPTMGRPLDRLFMSAAHAKTG